MTTQKILTLWGFYPEIMHKYDFSNKKASINTVLLEKTETNIYFAANSNITTEVFNDELLDSLQRSFSLFC